MYPIEKYKYVVKDNKEIIAISTYAGKTVKARASCNPEDKYDEEFGKKLAAARLECKVAKKRVANAKRKRENARNAFLEADRYYNKTQDYYNDSCKGIAEAEKHLEELIKTL